MPYYNKHTKESVLIWTSYFLWPNYDGATKVPLLSHTWFSHDFVFSFFKLQSLSLSSLSLPTPCYPGLLSILFSAVVSTVVLCVILISLMHTTCP